MHNKRDSGDNQVNRTGAAGQSTQDLPGEIESGQPAGGPDDLAPRSWEKGPEDDAPRDPLGAGIDAFGSGGSRDDCPYPEGSAEATEWLEGYDRRTGGSIAAVPPPD